MLRLSHLVLFIAALVITLAGWHFLDNKGVPSGPQPLTLLASSCLATPPVLIADLGRQDDAFAIFSNGLVVQQVCSSGFLTFTARGSAARGHGAHLVVSLQDQVLWEGEVLEPREFEIPVPGPGWLTLAFVNDYYSPPEDRNLWISNLSFMPDF